VSNQPGNKPGTLYVVATPIGNLDDMTLRAIDVLKQVDLIAAEDTRHSKKLLTHFGVNTKMVSCHDHNEQKQGPGLVRFLERGQSIALLSDAGTPLISDPGYRVVNSVIAAGLPVVPVPGPSAAIAALSVAGVATDRFTFLGFPPAKAGPCRQFFEQVARSSPTLVCYESPRRLPATLEIARSVFGPERQTVVARELTKKHESFARGTLAEVAQQIAADDNWGKGEIVLLFAGAEAPESGDSDEILSVLVPLLTELPLKQAVSLTATITGARKNQVYQLAISQRNPS
jgi:16S rRNA (cytidine1402-2'-O)-methyltransferase